MQSFLPYLSVLLSLGAVALALWVAVRAGRWRDSETAKALLGRVADIERHVELHDQRLGHIEDDIAALPTKADFARLEGEIVATCKIADRTERAVARLEGFLMEGKRS